MKLKLEHLFPILKTYPILLSALLTLPLCLAGCSDKKDKSVPGNAIPVQTSKSSSSTSPPPATGFTTKSSATRGETGTVSGKSGATQGLKVPKIKYLTGEDPEFAKQKGWPVKQPAPLPGTILPKKRILAYYGNPLSKRMGVLGEYRKEDMLRRLKLETNRWEKADPSTPVQPALHLIAVVAQEQPGKAGKYRMVMPDAIINQVYGWAKEANAILFIDIQTGHEDIRTILPRFEWILKNPDVHLGIDPEFNLITSKKIPGKKIGTYDAEDINYTSGYLKNLVKKFNLPPKIFTVHRFTRNGVTNYRKIALCSEVQIVMNMDGWGGPHLKRSSYKDYVVAEPVQYTGFKLFYHNDTKKGDPLMTPKEVLRLDPKPVYIMYQ